MTPNSNNNLCNVAIHYVQQLHIPVTATTLTKSLKHNPYYPSLYSLINVFNQLGIANQAYEATAENIHELTPPYIAYVNNQTDSKDFVLVTEMNATAVEYIAESKKTIKVSKDQFLNQWQNIVFVAESNGAKGETDYLYKLKQERYKRNKQLALITGAAVAFILSCALLLNLNANNLTGLSLINIGLILAIKLLGITVTILLLIYEIDKTNKFIKNICTTNANSQFNCDAVLNSKASKILGMSWGEVGFFYFAATLSFLLMPGLIFANKIPWLAIANSIAVPYIVFSIYYQWKIVKRWCRLCLTAQAVLLMEFLWNIFNFWMKNKPWMNFLNFSTIITVALCILFPIIIWYSIKPILLKAKAAPDEYAAHKRLLYNPNIFNSLLQEQPVAPDGWQHIAITIGNLNASNTIIVVSNPYCGACAAAHLILKEIIEYNKDVKANIIFTTGNSENDAIIVKHLLAIAHNNDTVVLEKALDDWYILPNKKGYTKLTATYPINEELEQYKIKLEAMNNWCKEAKIMHTPTFFINEKQLPEIYGIEELKHILLAGI